MNKSMDEFLSKFIEKVDGLKCILVTDSEGVELGRVSRDLTVEISAENILATTFATAAEQASKCGMGKNKYMIGFYNNWGIVIHINYLPLVISFYGSEDMNVGIVLGVGEEFKLAFDSLHGTVQSVENQTDV